MSEQFEQMCLPLMATAVHCFFRCPFVVHETDPYKAHALMERHYAEKHRQQIERIVGRFAASEKGRGKV